MTLPVISKVWKANAKTANSGPGSGCLFASTWGPKATFLHQPGGKGWLPYFTGRHIWAQIFRCSSKGLVVVVGCGWVVVVVVVVAEKKTRTTK